MTELKPCPFCGSNDVEIRDLKLGIYAINLGVYAVCRRCGASIKSSHSIVDVIAAWNRRAIDRDELLLIADDLDDCWESFRGQTIECGDIDNYEQKMAALIRKAVGA